MTSYFNISCPNVPGSLTLKQMARKSLRNSMRPQHVPPSRFLCGMPEHYFQHCSSTALPDLCLHKLMSGTYKGASGLPLQGMSSCSFWRLSSVKLSPYPALKYQNKISVIQSQKIMPASNGEITKIEIIMMEREGISPLSPLLAPGILQFHKRVAVFPFLQAWNQQGLSLPISHLFCLVKVITRSSNTLQLTANTATYLKQVHSTHLCVPPQRSSSTPSALKAAAHPSPFCSHCSAVESVLGPWDPSQLLPLSRLLPPLLSHLISLSPSPSGRWSLSQGC